MLIIDANTGAEVKIGQTFCNINGFVTLLSVEESLFSATGLFKIDNRVFEAPLTVHWMHPGFFGRKVAFINS